MNRSRASDPDYPAFTHIYARIGENPARFLTDTNDIDPVSRIRGIHDEAVLEAWYEVETELGPRREIIKHLNRQQQYLREKQDGECFLEYWDRVEGLSSYAETESAQAVATDGGDRQ